MLTRQRQRLIAQHIASHGSASVHDLAAHFDVSSETIRRDLGALEDAGHVERTHGGAVAATGHAERNLETRTLENREAKDRIARVAVDLLPPAGGSLLLDAGSTTAQLIPHIPHSALMGPNALLVITDSAPNAAALAAAGATNVQILGGSVRGSTGAVVGSVAVETLRRLRVDVAFLGTNGIDAERGLTTPDPAEAAVKQAMAEAARHVVVVTDSSKYDQDFTVSFADLDQVDTIVSDSMPTGALADALATTDVEVVVP